MNSTGYSGGMIVTETPNSSLSVTACERRLLRVNSADRSLQIPVTGSDRRYACVSRPLRSLPPDDISVRGNGMIVNWRRGIREVFICRHLRARDGTEAIGHAGGTTHPRSKLSPVWQLRSCRSGRGSSMSDSALERESLVCSTSRGIWFRIPCLPGIRSTGFGQRRPWNQC